MTKETKKADESSYLIYTWVILLVVVAIIISFIWYIGFREPVETEEISDEVVTQSDEIDTSNWLTYENEEYGFSFKYPGEWYLYKEDENVTFIDIDKDEIEKLDKEYNKSIENTSGTDALPKSDFHKINFRIKKSNKELQTLLIEDYLLNSEQNINATSINGRIIYFVENKEWIRQLIFATRFNEEIILYGDRYIEEKRSELKLKIMENIFKSIN